MSREGTRHEEERVVVGFGGFGDARGQRGGLGRYHRLQGHGADDVHGNDEKDTIDGNEGNDTLRGNEGDDVFFEGDGDDVVKGGPGADRVAITQQILGDDKMYGGPGNDRFSEEVGRNVLSGGPGNDYLYGHSKLVGGRGDDDIYGHARHEETPDEGPRGILGGQGNDRVRSDGDTNDTIYVSDGERDTVVCGGGTDRVYFDRGIDRFSLSTCENRTPR